MNIQNNSELILTPQLISKLIAKFSDKDLKITIEKDKLILNGSIMHVPYKAEAVVKKVENNIVTMEFVNIKALGTSPLKVLEGISKVLTVFSKNPNKEIIKDNFISYLKELIEKIISVYPGFAILNYPELLLDLNTIELNNGMKLTDIVNIENVIIDDNVKVIFS